MYWWFVRIFLLVFFLANLPAQTASAQDWKNLSAGLDYGTVSLPERPLTKIHFFKIDLKKWKVRVLDARDWQHQVMSVKDMADQAQAVLALNANFFDEKDRPLGLVLAEGKIKNPPKNISWWGALLVRDDEAQIIKPLSEATIAAFDNGIQAGPRLVIGGRVPKLKSETSPKSAVAIDAKGNLWLIVSEGSVEINELAQFLSLAKKKGGLGLPNALNLDGGSSTQLFAKIGEFQLNVPGINKVPIALGVVPRPTGPQK